MHSKVAKGTFKVITIATILETQDMESHGNGKTILIFPETFSVD